MQEIICPHCGKAFKIDEAGYAAIVKQVRDREFSAEVAKQTASAVKLAEAEKEKTISKLQAELEAAEDRQAAAVREMEVGKDKTIAELQANLDAFEDRKTIAVEREKHNAETQKAELEREMDRLKNEWEKAQAALEQEQTAHELAMKEKDAELDRVRDMKTKLSTKMVGETLEQHCEIQFNQLRAAAFPTAYFEKDNDASGGTKGDYIFRDYDDSGAEYISIMFEMKNEMETTATKHRNEDFFKKLDKDRRDKGCEYAVLVSMLEADSELYNTGIVDVSHRYEKMYVIRPQFFIPLISLLRNAARGSIAVRQELVAARNQNADVEAFTAQLNDFKIKFSKNYNDATNRYNDAIKEIEKTIDHLKKVKEALETSGEHLRRANTKVEDLSIKRLVKGNPTMTEKFKAAGIDVE